MAASGYILLKLRKAALPSDCIVVLANAVHRYPYRMRTYPGEVLLSVGCHRHGEKADSHCGVDNVVYGFALFPPQGRLAALQVHETRTGRMGASQILHYIIEFALTVAGTAVNGAVLAAEIALVGYEKYGLQRRPASEKAGANEPLGKVEILLDHLSKNISEDYRTFGKVRSRARLWLLR